MHGAGWSSTHQVASCCGSFVWQQFCDVPETEVHIIAVNNHHLLEIVLVVLHRGKVKWDDSTD